MPRLIAGIIFILIIAFFLCLFLYEIFMRVQISKKGRQVDARVLSCEKIKEEGETYYNVTVDFYGLDGKSIVKTIIRETPYKNGETIRCRYLDKKEILWVVKNEKARKEENLKIGIVAGSIMGILLLMLLIMWWTWNDKELPVSFETGFGYFIGILFLLMGVLGIRRKINMAKDKRNMQVRQGIIVDYTSEYDTDEDDNDVEIYYPIYEYEWAGDKRQLHGQTGSSGKKCRTIGRKVNIIVDPHTGKAVCEEDEKEAGNVLLIFGAIGVVVLALMLAISFGNLTGEDARSSKPSSSSDAGIEKTPMLDMICDYGEAEIEKCGYWIDIYEDGSGRILLFPQKAVSGRAIDQEITFNISKADMSRITQWMQQTDLTGLTQTSRRQDLQDAYITLYLYDGKSKEKYTGAGYLDEEVYAEIHDLLWEIIPREAWQEMEKRETEYYR